MDEQLASECIESLPKPLRALQLHQVIARDTSVFDTIRGEVHHHLAESSSPINRVRKRFGWTKSDVLMCCSFTAKQAYAAEFLSVDDDRPCVQVMAFGPEVSSLF
jgi:hypothetical protein